MRSSACWALAPYVRRAACGLNAERRERAWTRMCRGIGGRFLFSLAFSARIRSEAVPLAEDVTVRRIFPVGRRQSRESCLDRRRTVPRVTSPWSQPGGRGAHRHIATGADQPRISSLAGWLPRGEDTEHDFACVGRNLIATTARGSSLLLPLIRGHQGDKLIRQTRFRATVRK